MTSAGPGGPGVGPGEDHAPTPVRTGRFGGDPWAVGLGIMGGVLLGTGLTFAILGFVGVFEEPPPVTNPPPPTLTVPPPTTTPPPVVESSPVTEVAQKAIPSIVAVETGVALGVAGGSGVVYGEDGYVITNHHVVSGASSVEVVFADGARYPAEIIGSDPLTDLAVLRVGREDLAPIQVGSSSGLRIGERAIAVGNPLALSGGPSVTAGIISALDRSLVVEGGTILYGLVQTDAPITRGSSGGALLDGAARLIGITTAIAVSDVGAEGLGFAVPIDLAIGVVNDLIETGTVEHALLGIRGDTAMAERAGAAYPVGVLVTDLPRPSAYEEAGGRVNDVVTSVGGEQVRSLDQLLTRMRLLRAGDLVGIGVVRADQELELTVVLGRLES